VKEQSHKDEMSRALRGDFERLRERGVSTTLAPHDEAVPETVEIPVGPPDPPPEDDDGTPGTGWFGRLLGR
jgi:hypothetical protein